MVETHDSHNILENNKSFNEGDLNLDDVCHHLFLWDDEFRHQYQD